MNEPSQTVRDLEKKKEEIENKIKQQRPETIKKNLEKELDKVFKDLKLSKRVARKFMASISFNSPANPRMPQKKPSEHKMMTSPKIKNLERQKERLDKSIQREKEKEEQQRTAEEMEPRDLPDDIRTTMRKMGLGVGGVDTVDKTIDGKMEVYSLICRRDVVFDKDEFNRVRTDDQFKEVKWSSKGMVLVLQRRYEKQPVPAIEPAIER